MKNILTVVATSISLCACSLSSHILTTKARPPIEADSVVLYTTPPQKYEEIGLVDANSWGGAGKQAKANLVVKRLKDEAASIGANGVLIKNYGTEATGSAIAGTTVGTGAIFAAGGINNEISIHAVAIYVDPSQDIPVSGNSSVMTSSEKGVIPRTTSVADRLKELDALYNKGLITKLEYQERRKAILSSI